MADESNNMPPVPSEVPISDRDTGKMKFGVTWTRWFIQLKAKIDVINTSIANLAKFTGTGFITKDSAGAWVGRTITGTADDITVTNGDGSAGNPTISSSATGVVLGTYGDGTHVPQVTVREDGKITAIENVTITGGGGGGIALKGRVATYADLPSIGNTSGDAYLVDADQEIYVWNGTAWPAEGDGIPAGGSGSGYPEGTSFPVAPSTDEKFYRTDLNILFYFNGTYWLSVQEYSMPRWQGSVSIPGAGYGSFWYAGRPDFQIFISRFVFNVYQNVASTDTKYWKFTIGYRALSNPGTPIDIPETSIEAKNILVNTPTGASITPNIAVTTDTLAGAIFVIHYEPVGGMTGSCYPFCDILYRVIGV